MVGIDPRHPVIPPEVRFFRYVFRGPAIPNLSFGVTGCLGRWYSFSKSGLFQVHFGRIEAFWVGVGLSPPGGAVAGFLAMAIMGKPPNHPFVHRVFPLFSTIQFGGKPPIFGNIHVWSN